MYTPKETYKNSSCAEGFLGAEVQNMCPKKHVNTKRNVNVPEETTKKEFIRARSDTCEQSDIYTPNETCMYAPKETCRRDHKRVHFSDEFLEVRDM